MNNKFNKGDVVKFQGREEPCVVYRVLDPTPLWMNNAQLNVPMYHIRIEYCGMVPEKYLEKATGFVGNTFATDHALKIRSQQN